MLMLSNSSSKALTLIDEPLTSKLGVIFAIVVYTVAYIARICMIILIDYPESIKNIVIILLTNFKLLSFLRLNIELNANYQLTANR